MNSKNLKIKRLLFTMLAFCGIILIVCVVFFLKKGAANSQYISKMGWLYSALRVELPAYYKNHGYYPQNLEELTITTFGDEASASTLTNFYYYSAKTNFILSWKTPDGHGIVLAGDFGKITRDDTYHPQ
jgi:hypothetical protein